jgi:hypothetical protein
VAKGAAVAVEDRGLGPQLAALIIAKVVGAAVEILLCLLEKVKSAITTVG